MNDPLVPINADAVDFVTANVSREEWNTWKFAGYDDCGDECRIPPIQHETMVITEWENGNV